MSYWIRKHYASSSDRVFHTTERCGEVTSCYDEVATPPAGHRACRHPACRKAIEKRR